ncbi:Arsenite efflux pump ArsB, ACR3 family [Gracilibacillus ureilyticus]|uniref:Arsenite efflux pump ArsB, ACR3 family n=1 Tax=Gracilibacillus ureilyticus TaxID=531814 RepID=A0A1H9NB51_9BACI|nr:bile acid:sodium symporter [Gracilibacillus ureilyticus]SER33118.1 Arsenite efflux pump ArsB, ACR3 family [Gracilibacillus ureilyticus]
MNLLEKMYTLIILLSVITGLALGNVDLIRLNAESIIVPLLAAMLYITFLQIPVEEIMKAFKNVKFTYTSIAINFLWTPIYAWILAWIFLGDNYALYIGFIMLMVTPCTDWYLIFTGMAKGNVALSTAILPLNLILQLVLLPVYLLIFSGMSGFVKPASLGESIFTVLFIPFALAFFTKLVMRNRQQLKDRLTSISGRLPIIFLSLAIAAIFASHGQLLLDNLELMWKISVPVFLFFIINFLISQYTGKLLNFSIPDRVSLSLTTLARNSPIAIAIAMTAFPDNPLIALTLVIGPLLELPVLAVVSSILISLFRKK